MVAAARLLKFVISGAPGSGKGTISAWTVRDFGLKHLAAGDLLRAQMAAKTEKGLEAKQYIEKGQLVPDQLVTELVFGELKQINDGWLLDGYPRTLSQAKSLTEFTQITKVIDLHVPTEEIVNRIKGRLIHLPSGRVYNTDYAPPKNPGLDDVTGEPLIQRDDDRPEVVRARLALHQKLYEPILDYYRAANHYRGSNLLIQFTGTTSHQIYGELSAWLKKNYFA